MQRNIIEIDGQRGVHIPCRHIWMNETELANLFDVIVPTLRASIKAVYKHGALKPCEAERYIKLPNGCGMDVYNLQMVMALAFHIDTPHASAVRYALMERIMYRRQKERVVIFTLLDNLASVGLA